MIHLSKPQKFFAFTSIVLTILFAYFLHLLLDIKAYQSIPYYAIGYGVLMFLNGLLWGFFDRVRNSRFAIGFIYHLITYISVNTVFLIAMFFYTPMKKITIWAYLNQIVWWGVGLILHYYYSKKTIKGMKPDEIFE